MLYLQTKLIASKFPHELGFVNRSALKESESRGELELIPEIGFCHYHHRKDRQTTIYEIAVNKLHQNQGWGRLLFYRVLCSTIERGQTNIVAKCPTDLISNGFYESLGFTLDAVEQGRKRQLNRWKYEIKLPLLFYCGGGGKSRYDAIAEEAGWRLGIKSYEKNVSHKHMQMIDNPYKIYNHEKHLTEVIKSKPLICTARDIESPEQLPEILQQAQELSAYCGRVLLIPKCKISLPENYWLAYSVPTSYGGTSIEPSWFGNRPTHLLGGSPNAQAAYAKLLNVVSLDGNYAMRLAKHGVATWQGQQVRRVGNCYETLRLSLTQQQRYWHKSWTWEDEPLAHLA